MTTPTTPMSNTPETDAKLKESWKLSGAYEITIFLGEFARKLELERDALKSENASLKAKLEEWKKVSLHLRQSLEQCHPTYEVAPSGYEALTKEESKS